MPPAGWCRDTGRRHTGTARLQNLAQTRGFSGPAHDYERQLCTYAHILEQRYGKRPDRLLLYWTAEPRKTDALMAFPYRPERVVEAGVYFDQVGAKILRKDFTIQVVPENTICKECDLRRSCHAEGTIQLLEEDGR